MNDQLFIREKVAFLFKKNPSTTKFQISLVRVKHCNSLVPVELISVILGKIFCSVVAKDTISIVTAIKFFLNFLVLACPGWVILSILCIHVNYANDNICS